MNGELWWMRSAFLLLYIKISLVVVRNANAGRRLDSKSIQNMIQRIQTIFLVLTAVVFSALFKIPLATSDRPAAQFLSDQVFDINDHPALLAISGLGAIAALITVFLFKNRKTQMKFCYLIVILAILLPILAYFLFTNEPARADTSVNVYYQLGMFLPVSAVLFAFLANYFIRKDDKLVKSMDRLR